MLSPEELSWLKEQGVGEVSRVTQFENALTNDVFLITDQNKKFIFKRLNQNARSDEDRQSEFLVQQLASKSKLTAKVLAHNKFYKLQQYIEGDLIPINNCHLPKLLATQFHRIHQLPPLYAPKQRLAFELKRLKTQLPVNIDEVRFKQMLSLAAELDTSSKCDILCHGDLSVNNVLLAKDKQLYIIDWEYAVIGCAAYDLAFCNCINEFTETQCNELISHYFDQKHKQLQYTLESLQKECDLYFKVFKYINELWSLCFIENN
jgi:thiamine kinase-like enzyme